MSGPAFEYRVFWTKPGQAWELVEPTSYSVVKGGDVAQVEVTSPPKCDELLHYIVRARDRLLQEAEDSNRASVVASCTDVNVPVPIEDLCPTNVGAICGAFFGGLAAGLLIAALGYFLYRRFLYKPKSSSSTNRSERGRVNNSYTPDPTSTTPSSTGFTRKSGRSSHEDIDLPAPPRTPAPQPPTSSVIGSQSPRASAANPDRRSGGSRPGTVYEEVHGDGEERIYDTAVL